ncbi:EamA family transporter [Streptomyces stramineus]
MAWSYFVIVNRRVLARARPAADNSTWTACIGLGAFGGSLFLLPLAGTAGGPSPVSDAGTLWPFLLWCAALAVLGSWCATWFWNIASKRLLTTVMGPVIGMEAVFGAAFNLVWEGRTPTFHEFWGGLLVIAGVLLGSYLFHRPAAPGSPGARRGAGVAGDDPVGGPCALLPDRIPRARGRRRPSAGPRGRLGAADEVRDQRGEPRPERPNPMGVPRP